MNTGPQSAPYNPRTRMGILATQDVRGGPVTRGGRDLPDSRSPIHSRSVLVSASRVGPTVETPLSHWSVVSPLAPAYPHGRSMFVQTRPTDVPRAAIGTMPVWRKRWSR